MAERKEEVARAISEHCNFRYSTGGKQHSPFDFYQIRMIVAELEGSEPNPGADKGKLMQRIAEECGFSTSRYETTKNGPPPFVKKHLLEIRDELREQD